MRTTNRCSNSIAFSSSSNNPTDFGADPTRLVTWTVNDEAANASTASATTTLHINAVNDPPTFSNVATGAQFTESNGAVVLSNAVSVTDPDNLDLAGATVSITTGTFTGDGDQLTAVTGATNITASYNSTAETLILSGSDTLAHYQSVLNSVSFNSTSLNPTDFGAVASHQVVWELNDGSGSNNLSFAHTTTVSLTAVNNPPTLAGTANATFTEKGAAVTLSGSALVTDSDSLDLVSATVALSGGTFTNDGDLLAAASTPNITASYNASSETLILSGLDTLLHYQEVLDQVTFTSSSLNPTNFGADPTRTVTWTLNDGSASNATTTATSTLSNTAVNDPPTLNVAPGAQFTQGHGPVVLSGAAAASDPDSLDLTSATVSITTGKFTGDGDTLSATPMGAITASYNATSETLILSGSDTLADYQSVLDTVAFNSTSLNPTDFGAVTSHQVTWVLNDGSSSSNLSTVATTTVTLTAVHQPPTLSDVTNASYLDDGPAITIAGAASVSDPDSLTLASALVSIGPGALAGDILAATTSGTSITASYNAASETLTLTGSDTLADYQRVIDSVTFASANPNARLGGADPTRIVTWVLNDGSSSHAAAIVTSTISIADAPPTLTGVVATVQSPAFGAALSSRVTITDPDSIDLASATVAITGGTFAGDGDVLTATTAGTSITARYNSTTETLTLTGSDTLANYQSVLDTVTLTSGVQDTSRTVTWTVNDGTAASAPQTETVVSAATAPPSIAVAASAAYVPGSAAVTLSPTVSLSAAANALAWSSSNALSDDFGVADLVDGKIYVLDGDGGNSILAYDPATNSVTATGAPAIPVKDDLAATAVDAQGNIYVIGGSADQGVEPGTTAVTRFDPATGTVTQVAPLPFALTGATAATGPDGRIYVFGGSENLDGIPLGSVESYDPGTNTWSVIQPIGQTPFDNPPGSGSHLSPTAVTDGSLIYLLSNANHGLWDFDTATDSWSQVAAGQIDNLGDDSPIGQVDGKIIIIAQNGETLVYDPATGTVTTGPTPPTGGDIHLADQGALSDGSQMFVVGGQSDIEGVAVDILRLTNVSDLASATVAITGGKFAGDGDVLTAVTTGTSITASYNSTTETLTLAGTDTTADYQQVLESVAFKSINSNPTDNGADPTRTITWTVDDGVTTSTMQTETVTIEVGPVASLAASASFAEKAGAVVLSSDATVSDHESATLVSVTVAIKGGTFANDGDQLAATTTGTSITASYNSSTETLTLTGSDTLAHYQSVLDTVSFNSTSLNPTDYGSDPTRTVVWTLNDGTPGTGTATATSTVSITAVNDPPTLSNVAPGAQFTEGGGAVVLSNTVSVTDPDNLDLASATVSITTGTFTGDGDVLSANISGTGITASYNAAAETLILSGSDTLAHYQSVLDSVAFNSTSLNPTDFGAVTSHQVVWELNDGSGSNNLSAPATTTVSLTAVNNPPTLAGTANATFTEKGAAVTLSGSASVMDPDSQDLVSATVALSGGTFTNDGDLLTAVATTPNITASYNSTSETLILSGSDTLLNYQQVLDQITFTSSSLNPTSFGADPTRTVTWTLNDGSASNATTTATSTVSITAVNDPPTLSTVATSAQFTEGGGAVVLSNAVSVSDPDSLDLASATVSITTGKFTGDGDQLTAVTGATNITASYNSTAETLILSGSDTLAHYQSVLDSVSFNSTSLNPTNFGAVTSHQVTWVLNDGSASSSLSTAATTTVSLTGVNNPPTLAGTANATFTEKGAAVTLSGSAVVSDPDSQDLVSATVALSGGTFTNDGDLLTPGATTPNITASYNATSETLILSGSDTLLDYQGVLELDYLQLDEPQSDQLRRRPDPHRHLDAQRRQLQQRHHHGDFDGQHHGDQRPADPLERRDRRELHPGGRRDRPVGRRLGERPRQSQPRQRHRLDHDRQVHGRRRRPVGEHGRDRDHGELQRLGRDADPVGLGHARRLPLGARTRSRSIRRASTRPTSVR